MEEQRKIMEEGPRAERERSIRATALQMALAHERDSDDVIKVARKFAEFLADG